MESFREIDASLNNKTIAITGGTGSFGKAMIRKLLLLPVGEIRVISRDEDKQENLRRDFPDSRINCFIADVRDKAQIKISLRGADVVFHAAALKQVPTGEFFPGEVLATNTLGSDNVLSGAIENQVKKIVLLSTDKAVNPINAMGMSKALMEKIGLAKSRLPNLETEICITRYGNVLCSRGSVIPKFVDQISKGIPITITEGSMTRFLMSLDDAIDLVFYAIVHGQNGDTLIKKAPASTVKDLATAICEILKQGTIQPNYIGIRHGEKMHESLISEEEVRHAQDKSGFFQIPIDKRGVNFGEFVDSGDVPGRQLTSYSSNNTKQLAVTEIIHMLEKNVEFNVLAKTVLK